MKPASFIYHRPKTVDEALTILARVAPEDGRILAGGQSLVPTMAFRLSRPSHLVDINNVAGLDKITPAADGLSIGACVRHAAFHQPVTDGPLGKLLATVVKHIAHYPIRMRGTMCGSLANADPASEWCMVAATLDAKMTLRNATGSRVVEAKDYFQGVMTTALGIDEMLTEVKLPNLPADTRFGFREFSRRAGDFALAMSLAVCRLQNGVIAEPRIGVGGVEVHPRRMSEAEAALAGKQPGDAVFRAAAEAAANAVDPMVDAHANADYRRDLTRTMVRRALEAAFA